MADRGTTKRPRLSYLELHARDRTPWWGGRPGEGSCGLAQIHRVNAGCDLRLRLSLQSAKCAAPSEDMAGFPCKVRSRQRRGVPQALLRSNRRQRTEAEDR